MGEGLAQIGVVLAVTAVGLPLFFFALLAALDRFERSLSPTRTAVQSLAAHSPGTESLADVEQPDAEVVALPLPAANPSSAAAV